MSPAHPKKGGAAFADASITTLSWVRGRSMRLRQQLHDCVAMYACVQCPSANRLPCNDIDGQAWRRPCKAVPSPTTQHHIDTLFADMHSRLELLLQLADEVVI